MGRITIYNKIGEEFVRCKRQEAGSHKECSECHIIKEISEFNTYKSKTVSYCNTCWNTGMSQTRYRNNNKDKKKVLFENYWYSLSSEQRREKAMKYNYGIDMIKFKEMLASQDHKCEICKTSFTTASAVIDHNHSTNKVRGLLCSKCNRDLSLVENNPELINTMFNYLEKYK